MIATLLFWMACLTVQSPEAGDYNMISIYMRNVCDVTVSIFLKTSLAEAKGKSANL